MLLLPSLLALLVAAIATAWLARGLGRSFADVPTARSTHAAAVPRVGGLGILAGLGVGAAVALLFGDGGRRDAWTPWLVASFLYAGIGFADDWRRLPPAIKFGLQALAAAVAVALGLRWDGAGSGPFPAMGFADLTPLMTWLWLVACVILVNLLDGIDLITAGTSIVVLGAAAGGGAGPGGGVAYAVVGGAVAGMAFWNVSPARVFAGDAGTHLLGFWVGAAALGAPALDVRGLPWAVASAPLLPAAIDVGAGIVAKVRRGVAWWAPHSEHLHQRLVKAGFTHVQSALRYAGLALLGLLMVVVVAPRAGLFPVVVVSCGVLLWHLGVGHRRTRHVRWTGAAPPGTEETA